MKETGVRIVATIGLNIEAYGEIESLLRAGKTEEARRAAADIAQDIIDCGYTKDMCLEEITEVSLQNF